MMMMTGLLMESDRVDNFGVGTVLRSENPDFKPGDFVDGYLSKLPY